MYSTQFNADTIYTITQHPCLSNQIYKVLANGMFKAYYSSTAVCYLIPGSLYIGSAPTDTIKGTWSIIRDQYIAKVQHTDGSVLIDYGTISTSTGSIKLTLTDTVHFSNQQQATIATFSKQ